MDTDKKKIAVPIGFFSFCVKANMLRKFHENAVTRRGQRFSMVTENWY